MHSTICSHIVTWFIIFQMYLSVSKFICGGPCLNTTTIPTLKLTVTTAEERPSSCQSPFTEHSFQKKHDLMESSFLSVAKLRVFLPSTLVISSPVLFPGKFKASLSCFIFIESISTNCNEVLFTVAQALIQLSSVWGKELSLAKILLVMSKGIAQMPQLFRKQDSYLPTERKVTKHGIQKIYGVFTCSNLLPTLCHLSYNGIK